MIRVALFITCSLVSQANGTVPQLPSGLHGQRGTLDEILQSVAHTDYQTVESLDDPALLDIPEILEAQRQWRRETRELLVNYTYERRRLIESAPEILLKQQGRMASDEIDLAVQFALKGEKEFIWVRDVTPGRADSAREAERKFSWDGERLLNYEPSMAVGEVSGQMRSDIRALGSHYLNMVNISFDEKATHTQWYVPFALEHPEIYHVSPRLQSVDGHPCHVVSSARDVLWFDHVHGCALRRRVTLHATSVDDPGCLANLLCFDDFIEADRGLWWPQKCIVLNYTNHLDSPGRRGEVRQIQRISVDKIVVNNVSDETFQLDFPPGTLVADSILNKQYYMPEGIERLDEAISLGADVVNGQARSTPRRVGMKTVVAPSKRNFIPMLLIANVAVLLIATVVIVWKRQR